MSLVLYLQMKYVLLMKTATREFVSQSCISELTRLCGCWKSIFPHLVVCTCSFYFQGETPAINWWTAVCGSNCHWGHTVAKASLTWQECIIEMETVTTYIIVFADSFFQKASPTLRTRDTETYPIILPSKTHYTHIPPLLAHSNFPVFSPENNRKIKPFIESQKAFASESLLNLGVAVNNITFYNVTAGMCPLRQFLLKK